MKVILIKSLTLVNFMGEKFRKTEFHDDAPTTIAGMNGLGKSRHFDAFMWLMFGKDVADRKDYEIKSIVDGKPLQKCECSVEGELVVDGELITIKRSFTEQWVKPRGCTEQVFKGNQTECMWNGVPVKVGEYQRRINDIIDESVFKMLTNPLYFASMPWKDQREQLFQLVGEINAADIAKGNPAFEKLMERINAGKSLDEYKKELAFRKKRLKDELDSIQPKIEQTNALMPEQSDFSAIEMEIATIDAKIADIDQEIADVTAQVRAAYQAEQKKIDQANEIRRKMKDMAFQAETAARDAAYKANAARRDREREIADMERSINEQRQAIKRHEANVARLESSIPTAKTAVETTTAARDAFRQEVIAEKSRRYDGSTKCPCCGQELPTDQLAKIQSDFNETLARNVAAMVARGQAMNTEIEQLSAKVDSLVAELDDAKKALATASETLAENETTLKSMKDTLDEQFPIRIADVVNIETLPEYQALADQERAIMATINNDVTATADTTEYTARKTELNARRASLVATLANRETIARHTKAIADLENRGKDLAQQIADIEKDEFVIQEFAAANINECEKRINGLFHNVTFRLFDYTIDGNPIETCVPLVNGIPFGRANTAGRINAGLDIINALCRHYQTFAPIFLDNAESVNQFIETDGQVIMMRVTTDPELIIK